MAAKFKSENYIQIQGWMVTELKLSGNELVTYALIYGFSQDEESVFSGSISYLCSALNCTKPTARKTLKTLTEKGLLEKKDIYINNVKFCEYKVSAKSKFLTRGWERNLPGGGKETYPGGGKETFPGGGKVSFPNSKLLNNTINNTNNTYNNSEKKISDFPKAETSEKKESKTIKKTVVLEEKKGKAILSPIKAQNLQSSIILPKEKEKPKMTLFCAFQHAFWDVLHPDWTHGGAVDGKKMKNIIAKIKKRVDNKNPNATEEHYVQAWEMVLGNLPPFYQSANLSKIESALDGIIDEIITKTQKKNPKSSQAIHTIAKQAGIDADWRENVLKSQKQIN